MSRDQFRLGAAVALLVATSACGEALAQQTNLSRQTAAFKELWARGKHQEFLGENQIKIATRSFVRPAQVGAVVICSGRTECMLKYQELIYDLYEAGYSVYIFDHRG